MGRRYNRIKILVKEDRTPYTGKRDLFGGWRKKIIFESEWTPVAGSIANSTGTTFISTVDNSTLLHVTGLGGVEGTPKTATIDFGFGDTLEVPAPAFNLLGLQGYAPPLANIQRKKDQEEDERIDAEIRKLDEQLIQLDQKAAELDNERYETEPKFTGMTYAEYVDRTNEINAKWSDKIWPLQKKLNDNPVCIEADKCVGTKEALLRMSEAATKELENLYDERERQTKAYQKAQDDHLKSYAKKFDSITKEKGTLIAKIDELIKQRPINKQLDASQQAYPNLPLMNARVQSAAGTLQNPLINAVFDAAANAVFDTAAKLTGKEPAKKVFDYYNDTFLKNLSSNPPGSSPSNPVDMTKMMDKSEMNMIQSIVDTVMSDVNLTKNIDRENAMNDAFEQLTKTILVPTGLGFDAQDTATPNTRNIIGQLDPSKFDGFHIQKNGRVVLRKSYDFSNKPGDDDFAAAGGVGGIGASLYARYKGTPDYTPRGGESPSMHLQVNFNPTRNKRNRSGGRSQASSLASQQAYPTAVRTGQGGRSLGSTTQRQGGAINPSTPAPSATGMSSPDSMGGLPQPGDSGYVNPNVLGRLARSATDSARYSGNMMFQGNPAGRAPGLSNFWSPDPAAAGTYSNPGRAKGIPGTRPNPTGTLTTAPRPRNVPRVTRGLTGTPQFKFPKGQAPPSNMFTQTADDAAVKAAQNAAQKAGGKTLSKFLARAIPFANAALAGADAGNRVRQGDYFGAALGAATAIPGPAGWAALGGQMAYDAAGRPFMGSPATTPTSARGAGRSSFPTSDGNVVPRSNSANANSVGQRGSDGGMTDAQIKAAQDKANAARRAGKMSDIRGSQANKGFASDPKTGEPRYTGMNNRQYADASNKIADKYNKLRAPIERQYAEFSGQQAPASLMNKLNALNDAQTAEEDALAAKRAAQENAFNDALQDYNDKQDAANQARQDALDEIDNEEDPYSKLLAELGVKMEKLRREGKSVKRVEIIGPGEEGYVDTTNMANAIGYNRRIIYTAEAKALQKEIIALQDAQMKWYNNRQKRREDAEKADYSDAGGSSGSSGKGGRQFGGQGGLPIGTTTLRGGAGDSAGARKPTPPENMSQSAALARQAASARMNRQQKRKRGLLTQSTTWDRINKYRFIREHQTP